MKQKNIKEIIKNYFFLHPTAKFRVRQIERTMKIPLPSVIRYTKELEKEEILKAIVTANIKIYVANRVSNSFILQKRLFNIQQLFNSGLVEYIKNDLSNPSVIVFGSYSKGEDIESSDIDLYIETPSKKSLSLKNFEKKLERNIQLFVYKSIKKINNKELSNNIINGIILNGFVEVF